MQEAALGAISPEKEEKKADEAGAGEEGEAATAENKDSPHTNSGETSEQARRGRAVDQMQPTAEAKQKLPGLSQWTEEQPQVTFTWDDQVRVANMDTLAFWLFQFMFTPAMVGLVREQTNAHADFCTAEETPDTRSEQQK